VTAVGRDVQRFAVGDRVVALVEGSYRREASAAEALVFPLPPDLDVAAGSTLPVAFLTAYYGLHELAGMRAGHTVLIHAAAGGVGLAAVQLAQRAGATIIATAGSEEKRSRLRDLGVEHVLDSRTPALVEPILAITGGRGIDIAL